MPYKLEKKSWRIKKRINSFLSFLPLMFASFFWSSLLAAEVTLTSAKPYSQEKNVFFFPSSNFESQLGFLDHKFHAFELTAAKDDTTEREDGRPNMILFDVQSSRNFTVGPGQTLVVNLYSEIEGSSQLDLVPIAAAATNTTGTPGDCISGTTCQAYNAERDYFYSANYSQGKKVRLGIYASDLCRSVFLDQEGSRSAKGCNLDQVKNASRVEFSLRVVFGVVSQERNVISATAEERRNFTLRFETRPPGMANCEKISESYFPGDREILMSPGAFTYNLQGGAAADQFIVIAQKEEDPDTSEDAMVPNQNDIQARIPLDEESLIPGFRNSTAETVHSYHLAISVRNRAGLIGNFQEQCFLRGVQTGSIEGFLEEGQCFIATATFMSAEAKPVLLLRQFRDEVLSESKGGRAFIDWYYRHSPQAAQWLLKYPSLRLPVLTFLAPVQLLAWVSLNLFQSVLIWISFSFVFGGFLFWLRSRMSFEKKGQQHEF
jgi:hypothetical protein